MTRECFAAYLSLEIISCVVSTSTCCGSITAGWDEHLYGDEGLIDGLPGPLMEWSGRAPTVPERQAGMGIKE